MQAAIYSYLQFFSGKCVFNRLQYMSSEHYLYPSYLFFSFLFNLSLSRSLTLSLSLSLSLLDYITNWKSPFRSFKIVDLEELNHQMIYLINQLILKISKVLEILYQRVQLRIYFWPKGIKLYSFWVIGFLNFLFCLRGKRSYHKIFVKLIKKIDQ